MGEDTSQIEQEIREKRSDLGRNLDELQDKARELADWRTHYAEHSRVFLGAAFGAGLVLGLSAIPRPHRNGAAAGAVEPDTSHDPYPVRHAAGWADRVGPTNHTVARAKRQLGETWDVIADGLLRMVSARAIQKVADLVPGFDEHVNGTNPSRVRS